MLEGIKWGKRDNRISRQELRAQIERFSRVPFMDILCQIMQCRPDAISMALWATEHPDKWASMLSIIAKLGGYTDETTLNVNNYYDIGALSDAQLLQRLTEMRSPQLQIENQSIEPAIQTIEENLQPSGDAKSKSIENVPNKKKA